MSNASRVRGMGLVIALPSGAPTSTTAELLALVAEARAVYGEKLDWPERGRALWARARSGSDSDTAARALVGAITDHAHRKHWAHTTLGVIAARAGDVAEACEHLHESAAVRGDHRLSSYGPSFLLARELCALGEWEADDVFRVRRGARSALRHRSPGRCREGRGLDRRDHGQMRAVDWASTVMNDRAGCVPRGRGEPTAGAAGRGERAGCGAGLPTGYSQLGDGLVVRTAKQACPNERPRSEECRSSKRLHLLNVFTRACDAGSGLRWQELRISEPSRRVAS
jgi:hypothetical protein